jgi:hypothetical protein
MQRFDFSLEKALQWRATRLQEEEAKLLRLRQQKTDLLRSSAALEESALQSAKVIPEREAQITGAELACLAEFGRAAKLRLAKLAAQIRDADARIAAQMRVVQEADRQKQLLEDLKKEQYEEWQYEQNRQIEASAGELYLARWNSESKPR